MMASSGPVETGKSIENVFLNTLFSVPHISNDLPCSLTPTHRCHSTSNQRNQHGLETRAEQYRYQPYLNVSVLVIEAKTSVE